MKTLLGLITGLLLLQTTSSYSQISTLELEDVVHKEMEISGAPGAVIGVLKDSSIIYQKAFGLSNSNTNVAVNTSTVFHIGSISKTFTATALLIICAQKNIDIHAPIGNIIDYLSPKLSQVTIHQLLSQSSGIIDYPATDEKYKQSLKEYFLNYGDALVCDDLISVFSYTNHGYALAGLILAELNGSSYPKAIEDLLFDPLKMNNSTFDVAEIMLNHFSIGHSGSKVVQHKYTYPLIQPAGGMFSNVNDLSRFASCFMNNGMIDGQQIINKEVIKKMSVRRKPFGVMHQYLSYTGGYYNYGLIDFHYNGSHFIGHAGESSSQNALFAMNPENKTAFIVLSNTGYYPFIKSFEKMAEIFLPKNETSKKTVIEENDYSRFAGTYYRPTVSGSQDNIKVVEFRNQKLYIKIDSAQIFELEPIAEARFKFSNPEIKYKHEVAFFEDQNGEIKYLNYYWRTLIKK